MKKNKIAKRIFNLRNNFMINISLKKIARKFFNYIMSFLKSCGYVNFSRRIKIEPRIFVSMIYEICKKDIQLIIET